MILSVSSCAFSLRIANNLVPSELNRTERTQGNCLLNTCLQQLPEMSHAIKLPSSSAKAKAVDCLLKQQLLILLASCVMQGVNVMVSSPCLVIFETIDRKSTRLNSS